MAVLTFVSYAHASRRAIDELKECLKPLHDEGLIEPWYDATHIKPGAQWREAIVRGLLECRIAIFLVTKQFLKSPYIRDVESALLQVRAARGEVTPLVVIYDAADWQQEPWIERIQVLPGREQRIVDYADRSEAWDVVAKAVRHAAERIDPWRTGDFSLEMVLGNLHWTDDAPFFGRESSLTFLDRAYAHASIGVAAVWGFGGVGKSALVRRWLMRGAPWNDVRFIGCSFYNQGTRERTGTSDQFIVETLRRLGDPDPGEGTLEGRSRRLAQLASEQRTVIVLDGLEPLQYGDPGRAGQVKDAGVRELLAALTETPGKCFCVVTTRQEVNDPAIRDAHFRPLELGKLSPDAARKLLRHRHIGGSDYALGKAAERLGLHALALVLVAEYLATFKGGRIEAVRDIPLLKQTGRVKSGLHAESVMAAYAQSLATDEYSLALELLHIVGLFDRPVSRQWVDALKAPPAIAGVTERLAVATAGEIEESLRRLLGWRLITDVDPAGAWIDAHPLTREYFGDHLFRQNAEGWREAHARLYRVLALSAPREATNLDSLTTLVHALIHASKAGRDAEALHEVYIPRIMRGDELYALHPLGAFGLLLSALTHFFEEGDWGRPKESLRAAERMIVLAHAGICLTATRGYAAPEVKEVYETASRLGEGHPRETFFALFGLWRYALLRSEATPTRNLVERLETLRRELNDPSISAAAERVHATTTFYNGRFAECAEAGARGVALRQPEEILRRDAVIIFSSRPSVARATAPSPSGTSATPPAPRRKARKRSRWPSSSATATRSPSRCCSTRCSPTSTATWRRCGRRRRSSCTCARTASRSGASPPTRCKDGR